MITITVIELVLLLLVLVLCGMFGLIIGLMWLERRERKKVEREQKEHEEKHKDCEEDELEEAHRNMLTQTLEQCVYNFLVARDKARWHKKHSQEWEMQRSDVADDVHWTHSERYWKVEMMHEWLEFRRIATRYFRDKNPKALFKSHLKRKGFPRFKVGGHS